jgi:hypothetical protein
MSPSGISRRQLVVLAAILALVTPSIRSEVRLERREVDAHLRRAFEEVMGNRPDPATMRLMHDAFAFSKDGKWDKERTTNNIDEAIRRGDLGLGLGHPHRGGPFKAHGGEVTPPGSIHLTPPKPAAQTGHEGKHLTTGSVHPRSAPGWTSSDFVERVSAVIRRESILEEIRPATSEPLDRDQLRNCLKETTNVPDYDAVTESFHPGLPIQRITFSEPTKLLRLYGGNSHATGRYYFCCLVGLTHSGSLQPIRWTDASGLATPPDNLHQHFAVATIPAGTTVFVGTVADNFPDQSGLFRKGGNTQIFIPQVEGVPFEEYQRARDETAGVLWNLHRDISEIAVQLDDRILRFRATGGLKP